MKKEIIIREFTLEDVDTYMALRLKGLETNPLAFLTTVDEFKNRPRSFYMQRMENNLNNPYIASMGAFIGRKAVGQMVMVRKHRPRQAHIAGVYGVFVDPDYQRRGIAGRILDELIAIARNWDGVERLFLEVVAINQPAIALYESRGFKIYATHEQAFKEADSYYDEHCMSLIL